MVTDIKEMNFEEALKELENIVHSLEQGNIPLEEAIKAYEKGVTLKNYCEEKLNAVRLKVEQITIDAEGKAEIKPLELQTANE